MALAIIFIAQKGASSSEGQGTSFLSISNYIEKGANDIVVVNQSQAQIAQINSVFADPSIADNKVPQPTILATIQDNSIISHESVITNIASDFVNHTNSITTYTVQDGDNLSFIASDYGISVDSIMWANNLKNENLSVGQELKIPPVSGVIYTIKSGDTIGSIAKKFSGDTNKIIAFNGLPADGSIQVGDEIVIPDGKMSNSSSSSGIQKNVPAFYRKSASAAKFAYLPDLNSYYQLPTTGYDWGIVHDRNGVDVANSCGTPIVAAANGHVDVALSSGWNGGFGKYIRISHPNGTETLYAHLSKLFITAGSTVAQGQEIALMGTTGNSTGCHLHFEVHGARNPYAKY